MSSARRALLIVSEEVVQEAVAVVEEGACQLVLLGLLVAALFDAVLREDIDAGLRVAEKDRRVGRYDKLGAFSDEVVHPTHESEVAAERQRGFWFVKHVEAVGAEAVEDEREE